VRLLADAGIGPLRLVGAEGDNPAESTAFNEDRATDADAADGSSPTIRPAATHRPPSIVGMAPVGLLMALTFHLPVDVKCVRALTTANAMRRFGSPVRVAHRRRPMMPSLV
jgi:hypothetical protein